MTPKEFEKIAKTMRKYGIARFKSDNVEIEGLTFGPVVDGPRQISVPEKKPHSISGNSEEQEPIKHKVEQLTSLMKLSDSELVDELFPDEEEQSA